MRPAHEKGVMPILHAHSFLVHPGKNEDPQPDISGAAVPRRNAVFDMLSKVYEGSRRECDIEIAFKPSEAGRQENPMRDLLLAYHDNPSVPTGRAVAERLQTVTTHRSGLGLLFLAVGDAADKVLMVSRFPAGEGVMAEEREHRLEISFIPRVFMKNVRAYKSVVYPGPAVAGGLWSGFAVDKQIREERELSDYWIGDFLKSDFATTSAAGTMRIALALRDAIDEAEGDLRTELIHAALIIRNFDGQVVSVNDLTGRLNLAPPTQAALRAKIARPEMLAQTFRFDRAEYDKSVPYRTVELANGAVLTAQNAKFDEVFDMADAGDGRTTFSTTGEVVKNVLRKRS